LATRIFILWRELWLFGFRHKGTLGYSVSFHQHLLGFSIAHKSLQLTLTSQVHKDDTAPEIFRHNCNELRADQ